MSNETQNVKRATKVPLLDANYILQNVYEIQKVNQKMMYLMITVNLLTSENLLPMANTIKKVNNNIPKIVSNSTEEQMLYVFQPIDVETKAPYGESQVVLGTASDLESQGYVKFNEHMFYSQIISSSILHLKEQVELIDEKGDVRFGYAGDYVNISLFGEFSIYKEKEFKKKFNFEK